MAPHRGKAVLVQVLTLASFVLNWFFITAPSTYFVMAVAIAASLVVVVVMLWLGPETRGREFRGVDA